MLTLPYIFIEREPADIAERNIKEHMRYIQKFNPDPHKAELVAREILYKIMDNNQHRDDYTPYIKKLARVLRYREKEEKEKPYDVITPDGEISKTFRNLTESIVDEDLEDRAKLRVRLRRLYLKHEDNFRKLSLLFDNVDLDTADFTDIRGLRLRNVELYNDIKDLINEYGVSALQYLGVFLKDLPNLINTEVTETFKELSLKPVAKCENLLAKLEGNAFTDKDGRVIPIDTTSYLSSENPDYLQWKTPTSNQRLMKVDITPFMEYLYDQIYVSEGINTRHILWCDSSYKMTTPSGDYYIDEKREFFINRCRVELLAAIVKASIGQVLAVSPDNVYVRGKHLKFLKMSIRGKVIILPIEKFEVS